MPYIYYNPNPLHLTTDDCTIRAISKLMDTDWDTAFLRIAFQGFSQKQMMVTDSVWEQYLKDNGFRIVPLPNTCPNCYTVRQFAQFQQQFQGGGQPFDGRAQVMQKLQSGEMSQADFEQCRRMANQMTGMNY